MSGYCPTTDAGWTITLRGDPYFLIYDFGRQRATFQFRNGTTHTFEFIDQFTAQKLATARFDATLCYTRALSSQSPLDSLVLMQPHCPIELAGGGLLESMLP